MSAGTYRGWSISFDYPPIPTREFDWSATSPDYDCDGDSEGFHRVAGAQVHGRTRGDVVAAIDAWIAENAPATDAAHEQMLRDGMTGEFAMAFLVGVIQQAATYDDDGITRVREALRVWREVRA